MSQIVRLSQLDIKNGIYTYADYLTWKFDQAVELIKGKIFPMSAPSRRHQAISGEVHGLIYTYFRKHSCQYYAAPFDVRLFDKRKVEKGNKNVYSVIQPDICIICDEAKLDDKGCIGAPDLIIEILSPGNSSKEMRLKKSLYEENGVKEYLIFDPEHETVFQFHLTEEGIYSHATIYAGDEILTSVIFPSFKIKLKKVFSAR